MTILPNINPLIHFSYLGVFIVLSCAGYFIPLPEEVILLTIGYLASAGKGNVIMLIIIALSAVLIGDTVLYWLSRKGSKLTNKLISHVSRSKYEKFRSIYHQNSSYSVFFMRLIVGLRFLGPFLAGSEKLFFGKFLIFDLLALIIYVPTFIYIGYHFNAHCAAIVAEAMIIRHILFIFFIGVVGLGIVYYLRRKFYIKNK